MNDMDLVRSFREPIAPVEPAHLAAARAHVVREAQGQRRSPAPRRRPGRRLRLSLAGAVALVVVAAGAFVADRFNVFATIDPASAEVLNRAALVALEQPDLTARPDQFVYIDSRVAYQSTTLMLDGSGNLVVPDDDPGPQVTPRRRQVWLSVDGSRTGLLRNTPPEVPGIPDDALAGCVDGHRTDNVVSSVPCEPLSAVRTDLPTTPDAMLDWLYHNSHGQNPRNVQAFITIGDTIREALVPPAALSAMFAAAARIPGASIDRTAVDIAGRHGIGVRMSGESELIFDAVTFAYLGSRGPVVAGQPTGSAILQVAVVDSVGQL